MGVCVSIRYVQQDALGEGCVIFLGRGGGVDVLVPGRGGGDVCDIDVYTPHPPPLLGNYWQLPKRAVGFLLDCILVL